MSVRQSVPADHAGPLGPVLMVSPLYLPDVYGGAEQQCQRLSKGLMENGVPVRVLAGCLDTNMYPVDEYDTVPITRLQVPATPDLGGPQILATIAWTRRALRWLGRNGGNYSVLHVHQAKLHILPILLYALRRKVPIVVKIGNAEEGFDLARLERKRPFYGRWIVRLLLRRADRFIAISSRIRDQLLEAGVEPARIASIPNGIPIDSAFSRIRPPQRTTNRIFVLVGRMSAQKDPLKVCRAFLAAAGQGLRARLLAVGDGELLPAMRDLCANSRYGSLVEFLGRRDDVPELLKNADFIVFASRAEGLSNALLEAMNAGVVPIATAISGATDLITERNGFLFDPRDEAALVNTLLTANSLDHERLNEMKEAARRGIAEGYGMEHVVDAYLQLYRDLLRQRVC